MLNVPGALAARDGRGGTAPSAVAVQLAEVKADLAVQREWAARQALTSDARVAARRRGTRGPPRHEARRDAMIGSVRHRPDETQQPSVAELVKQASEQLSDVVRSEMRLAQAEMKEKGKKAGFGGGMFGGAAVLGLLALWALVFAAIAGLALVLPVWASALVIAGALLLVAGVLALVGKRELGSAVPPKPSADDRQRQGGRRGDQGRSAPMTRQSGNGSSPAAGNCGRRWSSHVSSWPTRWPRWRARRT